MLGDRFLPVGQQAVRQLWRAASPRTSPQRLQTRYQVPQHNAVTVPLRKESGRGKWLCCGPPWRAFSRGRARRGGQPSRRPVRHGGAAGEGAGSSAAEPTPVSPPEQATFCFNGVRCPVVRGGQARALRVARPCCCGPVYERLAVRMVSHHLAKARTSANHTRKRLRAARGRAAENRKFQFDQLTPRSLSLFVEGGCRNAASPSRCLGNEPWQARP